MYKEGAEKSVVSIWSVIQTTKIVATQQGKREAEFRTSDRNSSVGSVLGSLSSLDRLVGLVVRRPPQERKVPGSNPACAGILSGSSHTSDFKIGTAVATLPGAWHYRVSAGTGRPGVSILWLGEVERLICSLYLSVAAGKLVWADPSLRYTRMLLGR